MAADGCGKKIDERSSGPEARSTMPRGHVGKNMHNHYNGLKTTLLFSGIFALLLALGSLVQGGQYIWLFALFGVAMTAYGYWNSDKIAIRAMRARPDRDLVAVPVAVGRHCDPEQGKQPDVLATLD